MTKSEIRNIVLQTLLEVDEAVFKDEDDLTRPPSKAEISEAEERCRQAGKDPHAFVDGRYKMGARNELMYEQYLTRKGGCPKSRTQILKELING